MHTTQFTVCMLIIEKIILLAGDLNIKMDTLTKISMGIVSEIHCHKSQQKHYSDLFSCPRPSHVYKMKQPLCAY